MKHTTASKNLFLNHLGRLFFAIAATDNTIETKEIETLQSILKTRWLPLKYIGKDGIKQIESTFNKLHKEQHKDAEALYQDFVNYKNKEQQLFTKKINSLLLETCYEIASSFAKRNKSELIMLTKLSSELKKINH